MMVSKRNLPSQGAIFRFHVKLWEGTLLRINKGSTKWQVFKLVSLRCRRAPWSNEPPVESKTKPNDCWNKRHIIWNHLRGYLYMYLFTCIVYPKKNLQYDDSTCSLPECFLLLLLCCCDVMVDICHLVKGSLHGCKILKILLSSVARVSNIKQHRGPIIQVIIIIIIIIILIMNHKSSSILPSGLFVHI